MCSPALSTDRSYPQHHDWRLIYIGGLFHFGPIATRQDDTECQPANVRFGSLADINAVLIDVCRTPENGHQLSVLECPLCVPKADKVHRSKNDRCPNQLISLIAIENRARVGFKY